MVSATNCSLRIALRREAVIRLTPGYSIPPAPASADAAPATLMVRFGHRQQLFAGVVTGK